VLFAWTSVEGISHPGSNFSVSILAASVSTSSIVVAVLSYFFAPEKIRNKSALLAYLLLLVAISVMTLQTGQQNSPFLSLWMVTTIFSGIFGMPMTVLLFTGLVGYIVWAVSQGELDGGLIAGVSLAGFLPLLISYVLWHGKSGNEKTKERAYYDLANELNQVANKSDVVIGAISDGVIAINNQGQIELINPAAQRIVGWDHQDALNLDYKSVLQLLSKDSHELDKTADPVLEVLTTNQPKRRDDLQLQTSSGKKINIEVVVSPIGRIGSGAIIVFRDITKEQAEERAQAEFISTASHEMRTPVASIEGYLGLALNPATAAIDAKARDFITKAHEAAQHLGRLFQDLLDVTKADDGRLSNNPKVIDVIEFTNIIIDGLRQKADEKKLRLFFKAYAAKGGERTIEPAYFVYLDEDHIREVLSNLVENAIKYTPAGEVVVDVQGDDEHVVISVRDSGIGIPAEDIPHLFQKFYRVDNSDTREIGGTGLGLYLCRRLVEGMGGRIWVDSEYRQGSTFSVELPRISHEEASHRIEEAAQPQAVIPIQPAIVSLESVSSVPVDHKATALGTPIILGNKTKINVSIPQAAASTEHHADALIGGPAPQASPEPLRPVNPTMHPPSTPPTPSNLPPAPIPGIPTPPPVPNFASTSAQAAAAQPTSPSRSLVVPKR